MAAPSLKALPDTVVVDNTAGVTSGRTYIYYEKDYLYPDHPIWERIVGQAWTIVPQDASRVYDSKLGPDHDGVFYKDMTPGQVYQVRMYHNPYIDPNAEDLQTDPREQTPLDAEATAVAMLKAPERVDLILTKDSNVGGTWFKQYVETKEPTTMLLMAGAEEPINGPDIPRSRFMPSLGTRFDSINTVHELQIEPLLAGNTFNIVGIVIDEDGNWERFEKLENKTKERKVTIVFDDLHISNDGSSGDTQGSFKIWVKEGSNTVGFFEFGDENFDITDMPDDDGTPAEIAEAKLHEHIPLGPPRCNPVIIGPKKVDNDNFDVGILTRGLAYNWGEDDPAANFFWGGQGPDIKPPWSTAFNFPYGKGENVQNVPFQVLATPQIGGDEFEYAVKTKFTVEYL